MCGYALPHEVLMQNAATGTGNGVEFDVSPGGVSTIAFQVVIADTATITFETTLDGSTWSTLAVHSVAATDSTTFVASVTASGFFTVPAAGLWRVRARISSHSAGAVTVIGRGQV